MALKEYLDTELPTKLLGAAGPKDINVVIGIDVIGVGGWLVNIGETLSVVPGDATGAGVIVQMEAATAGALLKKPSLVMKLFFDGKIKVSGDISAMAYLPAVFR